jgi:cytochrome P450
VLKFSVNCFYEVWTTCVGVTPEQNKVEITGGTKHFMAFGGGLRFCVGTDLSKVLMATFIHCLVTKYR